MTEDGTGGGGVNTRCGMEGGRGKGNDRGWRTVDGRPCPGSRERRPK